MLVQVVIVVLIGIVCFLCGFILFERNARNRVKNEYKDVILKSEIGDIRIDKNSDNLITITFSDNNGGFSFVGDRNSIQQCNTVDGILIDYNMIAEVSSNGNEE